MIRIARNFSFLTFSSVVQKLVNFAALVVLTRFLGVEGFGAFSVAVSFVSLFNYVFDGGTNLFLIREVAKDVHTPWKFVRPVFNIKLLLAVVTFILLIVSSLFLNYSDTIFYSIIVYGLYVFFVNLTNTFTGFFTGLERMEYDAAVSVISRIFIVLLITVLTFLGVTLPSLMLAYLVPGVFIFCVIVYLYFAYIKTHFKTTKFHVSHGSIIKEALPFAVGTLMGEFFFHVDKVMLSKLSSVTSVGFYNSAYKLSYVSVFIASSITMPFYPYFARKWHQNPTQGANIFYIIFKLLLAVSVPIALTMTIYANKIVLLVFGVDYLPSVLLLQTLTWSIPPIYLTHLTARAMEAMGFQRVTAKSMLYCSITDIFLNVFFIKWFGPLGAAISTVFASLLLLYIHVSFLQKQMSALNLFKPFIAILLPAAGFTLTVALIDNYLHWMASIV
ncbi:MAG: flippase, partial [Candidatus Magnetoovum sp. WYHC-5]|nr:flippase [Candidatus Magnetoovum sp. WYHC-5]